MENSKTIEAILDQIKDEALKIVAKQALFSSRKALDITEQNRIKYVVDEIDKIMPKALKIRGKNEIA